MHVPQLPIEIIDAITLAHFLADPWDKGTLWAIARVRRAWLPVARVYLYKSLPIDHSDIVKTIQFLQGDDGKVVADYVKELRLRGPDEGKGISTTYLPPLLACFTRLESLHLFSFPFKVSDLDEPTPLHQYALKNVHVDYEANPDDSIMDLVAFLNVFSEIETLHISNLNWSQEMYISPVMRGWVETFLQKHDGTLHTNIKIRSIRVGSDEENAALAILEIFRRDPTFMKSVKGIHADTMTIDEFAAVCRLLGDAGTGIEKVTLGIPEDFCNDPEMLSIWRESERKISFCTSISFLTVHIFVTDGLDNDSETSVWSSTTSLLGRVQPSLTHLKLVLQGNHEGFLESFYASERRVRLDYVLKDFPMLESVELVVLFDEGRRPELLQSTADILRTAMPSAEQRGLLKWNFSMY